MPEIALAPLTVGILLCWATSLAEEGSARLLWAASLAAVLIAFALLFSTVFVTDSFWDTQVRVAGGAYAGLLVSPAQDARLAILAARAPR